MNDILLLGLGGLCAVWSIALVAVVAYLDHAQRAATAKAMAAALQSMIERLGELRRLDGSDRPTPPGRGDEDPFSMMLNPDRG